MIVQAKVWLYVPCPGCTEESHRADQLTLGQSTTWSCDSCHKQFHIMRLNERDFQVELTGVKETPVVVTLRSTTKPAITVRLNTQRYAHSQKDTWEDYVEHQRYFYDEHTCPTNWMRHVEEISVGNDFDPHGIFEFVSVENGRLVDDPYCGPRMLVEKP